MTRVGVAGVLTVVAAGLWLIAAPFTLGYQPPGAGWTGATRIDVITGGALAAAGFAGGFAVVAGRVRELYSDARSAESLTNAALTDTALTNTALTDTALTEPRRRAPH